MAMDEGAHSSSSCKEIEQRFDRFMRLLEQHGKFGDILGGIISLCYKTIRVLMSHYVNGSWGISGIEPRNVVAGFALFLSDCIKMIQREKDYGIFSWLRIAKELFFIALKTGGVILGSIVGEVLCSAVIGIFLTGAWPVIGGLIGGLIGGVIGSLMLSYGIKKIRAKYHKLS